MERRELNRMFDRLAPSPEQEQAVLDRLLQTERKVKPMKKLKKLTVLGIAAALMIVTCAAAVVTGFDQRLADYFGAGPEQVELLTPGAVSGGVTVEDNGAVLHISQVLMDRYSILILADFTAPEGTVLDMGGRGSEYFGELDFYLLDENGVQIPKEWMGNRSIIHKVLEYEGSPDNHLTLLFNMLVSEGFQRNWNVSKFHLPIENIAYFDMEKKDIVSVYDGNWSCDIPLPQQDIGQSQQVDIIAGTLDDVNIKLTEIYLSPMTLTLEREVPLADEVPDEEAERVYSRWISALNITRVTLKDRDGQEIPLVEIGGAIGDQEHHSTFRFAEITSLEQLQGGTLTLRIGDGSVDVPLEGLAPVE